MSEHVLQNNKPGLPWPTAVRHTVAAADSLVLTPSRGPWTLSVSPAAGGSYLVEVSASPPSSASGDVIWHPLEDSLTEKQMFSFPSPVAAIRVTATGAASIVELVA
jgi:hypothetical protein